MNNFDLVIAHRVYPGISKSPFIKNKSKLELFEINLLSLRNAIGFLNVKIFFILDNCTYEFVSLIKNIFKNFQYELIIYKKKQGNVKTFLKQIEILLNQNFSEYIYFSEDDYIYKKKSLQKIVNIYKKYQNKIDFITLYDNPEYNYRDFHNYKKQVNYFDNLSFIKVSSTTLTFLTSKKILKQTRKIFETFRYGNYDSSIFLSLTKIKIFPFQNFHSLLFEKDIIRFLKAWIFGSLQILFGKKYNLFSVTPAKATHMEDGLISKKVNWIKIIKDSQ